MTGVSDGRIRMDRRALLLAMLMSGWAMAPGRAFAKDGEGSGGDGGGGGSGQGGSGGDHSGGTDSNQHKDSGGDDKGDDGRDDDELRRDAATAVDKGEIAPLTAISRVALAHTPGRIIDVKMRRRGSSYTYRIRILARNGRRRELFIDARSRAILKVK